MATSIEGVERLQDSSLIGILYDIYKISDSIRLPQKDSPRRFDLCILSVESGFKCHAGPWFAPDYGSHVN